MKADDWRRLAQPVLGSGWRLSKSLAYRVPVGWILYGLLAEASADQRPAFYLWTVRMPLLVPSDVVDLSWSVRFGGSSTTHDPASHATERALRQAAMQVTEEASSGTLVLDPPGGADNVRMQEARGYGLLLMGNAGGASEVLGRVGRYEARFPWERELVARASTMRARIETGQSDDAVRQLKVWRRETISALGIRPK